MKNTKENQFIECHLRKKTKSLRDVIIFDLFSFNAEGNKNFRIDLHKLNNMINILKQSGSFWLIINHIKIKNQLKPYGFELAKYLTNQGLLLRNILVWFIPNNKSTLGRLTNRYVHIYFFVKDHKKYIFNKDSIREKHIWKDIEWGKRSKRYHPLGKDPGNVWLKVKDDGKGNKTKHIPLVFEELINRIKLVACPINGNIVLYSNRKLKMNDIKFVKIDDFIEKPIDKSQNNTYLNSNKKIIQENLFYKVINRTSEKMFDIKNEEVDLIVTSPPYWDMKNYGIKDQIGYSESYKLYLSRINKIWKECYRVLKKQGTFWLNINTKMHNKSLQMIQYDFYKQCIKIGFKLWDIIIWHKSVSGPAPDNNLTDKFEYFLVFYKTPKIYFNKEYEFKRNDYLISNIKGMGNIWNINRYWGSIGKNYPHPSMYPDELIERILNISSVKGNLILDPFLGSGTTLIVAKKLSRSCIGYEINSDYFAILKKRLLDENLDNLFTQNQKVQFIN